MIALVKGVNRPMTDKIEAGYLKEAGTIDRGARVTSTRWMRVLVCASCICGVSVSFINLLYHQSQHCQFASLRH